MKKLALLLFAAALGLSACDNATEDGRHARDLGLATPTPTPGATGQHGAAH